MTQKMCIFVFDSILDQYKTQEICDTVVYSDPPVIVYCPDKYTTQKKCDKVVSEDPFLMYTVLINI